MGASRGEGHAHTPSRRWLPGHRGAAGTYPPMPSSAMKNTDRKGSSISVAGRPRPTEPQAAIAAVSQLLPCPGSPSRRVNLPRGRYGRQRKVTGSGCTSDIRIDLNAGPLAAAIFSSQVGAAPTRASSSHATSALPLPFRRCSSIQSEALPAGLSAQGRAPPRQRLMRNPVESGHGFRREGGNHSGLKAVAHSVAKAATFGGRREGGRHPSEGWPLSRRNERREGSDAVASSTFTTKGERCRHGDSA